MGDSVIATTLAPRTVGTRVLIVEDEARYRDLLLRVLRDMDCFVAGVGTARDALMHVREHPVDVLFLDLHLPGMDGLTLLERIRERAPNTPVVILTGHGDLNAAKRAIILGVTEFLTKPCHLGDIEAALDRARRRAAPCDAPPSTSKLPESAPLVRSLEEVERRAIRDALRATQGNRSEAARLLGISRRALYNKLADNPRGIEVEDS